MSYNEVGWLPVRGLGAWPGACINSTSATSVRLPLACSRSLCLSLSLVLFLALCVSVSPTPRASPLLASSPAPLAALLLSSCPPFSSGSFGLLRCPHSALASLRLPASTHQRSVPMRARSRIRRGEFGDPLPSASRGCSRDALEGGRVLRKRDASSPRPNHHVFSLSLSLILYLSPRPYYSASWSPPPA